MGLLQRITTVSGGRMQVNASSASPYGRDFFYTPEGWLMQLRSVGMAVSPELAMTLSAVYCAVTTIADDIATMPCQLMRYTSDEGDKERARNHPLSYLLRWQPNSWQTAKEFWTTMIGHLLLRNMALAEIVPGPRGAVDQLIPRHPDRIIQERLPNGRIRYQLVGQLDAEGRPKTLTQDEVFVLRDLTSDGLNGLSRIASGAQAISSAVMQERFTANFFKKGATHSHVVIHKGGELEEEDEVALHGSLSRYAGAENAMGFLVIEDDIDIKSIGVDPDKAQLLGLKDYSVREVARMFKMPGHKLEASQQTQAYAAREQANLEYVTGCLRPIVVGTEQAVQRDLVIAKETYFAEFLMEALLRGDLKSRADYYSKAIVNRWMWPSEVRRREGMNGDPELDALSKSDHRAGDAKNGATGGRPEEARSGRGDRSVRATLMTHDQAVRCIRRERAAVDKLAKKHASDVPKWQAGLREFYEEHAGFVADVMRVPISVARAYAAQHGSQIEAHGVVLMTDRWERDEAEELTSLSLEPESRAA